MSRRDARGTALEALGEVLDRHRALGEVEAFDRLSDSRERAFARRLSYGVLRWKSALDWLADACLERPLKPRERAVRRLLLLGIYQLWQEDTADHAAVHATADAARRLGKPWAVGLVNAVLRRFQREESSLLAGLGKEPARFAHPPWMLEAIRQDWPEDWEGIVAANNEQAPLWLRNNQLRQSSDAGAAALEAAGFTVERHALATDALAISPAAPVEAIPGFGDGLYSVQDAAAQLAAALLEVAPGHRVLDACAAPGGKTCHLLESAPGASVLALDLSPERLGRVRENLLRLGLEAELKSGDGAEPDSWWNGVPFDRILLDAPCTATGVVRRHPEIKWLRNEEQLAQAEALQSRLLQGLWPLLKAGGILVYATCSVLRRENNQQIQSFLETHPDAECTGPEHLGRPVSPGRQILPGDEGMDGFYYAVLRKAGA